MRHGSILYCRIQLHITLKAFNCTTDGTVWSWQRKIALVKHRSQWSSGNMPDCGVRGPRFESHRGQLHVYRKHHYDIQPWARAVHPYTAVPRSTQPSTLRGTVKWVSAFGLSNNNKWRWWPGCGFWQPTGGLTARVVWPGLKVGGRLAPCHIHHMNRVNSRSGFSYDDSTINIVVGMIIIIIIIIIITEYAVVHLHKPRLRATRDHLMSVKCQKFFWCPELYPDPADEFRPLHCRPLRWWEGEKIAVHSKPVPTFTLSFGHRNLMTLCSTVVKCP